MSQKLKGIYDALDHGNYKNALKLCSAFLKKESNHALCKALNAVALERCGRKEEALQLCDDAQTSSGVDDTVLSTLQVVYKRCRQHSRITLMYEAAYNREPENKDYAMHLFSAAIRERDFAKSQQVATKLYRKLNLPKYLHWVVVSILLQARDGAPAKVLDLAEMMLKKAPINMEPPKDDGRSPFDRGQHNLLILHLTTLQMNGKWTQALEMLEACKACIPFVTDVVRLRVKLFAGAGQLQDAAREARALVRLEPANWSAAQECIDLAFRCPCPRDDLPKVLGVPNHGVRLRPADGSEFPEVTSLEAVEDKKSEDEVWNALLLFRYLQREEVTAPKHCRVPHLAELEIRRQTFLAAESAAAAELAAGRAEAEAAEAFQRVGWKSVVAESDFKDFVAGICKYLSLHGKRNDCYFDLKPFLCLLEESATAPLFQALEQAFPAAEDAAAVTLEHLRRGFQRPAAGDDAASVAECSAKASVEFSRLTEKWAASCQSGDAAEEADASSSTRAPDELLMLAVVHLIEMDRAQCYERQAAGSRPVASDRVHLLDAIALAEMGLATLPHCFHFKVILVLLYGALGLPSATIKSYTTMEIKNIQHESLSYLALDGLCSSGCHDVLYEACRQVESFHEDFEKDTTDILNVSFHSGVYQRIPEYVESLQMMSRSILRGRAAVEEVQCEIAQAQTYEALIECMGRQETILHSLAGKAPDFWVFRNQDRAMLQGLHPLPICSPVSAGVAQSSSSWSGGGAVPTNPVHSGQPRGVNYSAVIWNTSAAVQPSASLGSDRQSRPSAVQELLTQGLQRSPARLRSSISLLHAVSGLLQKKEETLKEALDSAKEALAAEGVSLHAGGPVDLQDARLRLAVPWCPAPADFAVLVRRSALTACEVGHLVSRSMSGEAWDLAEKQLSALSTMLKACLDAIQEESFALMEHGLPMLWMFLNECAIVLIPVALWCASCLPKAGSGKKPKEGQEALHATRVALKSILALLQSSFTELQDALSKCLQGAEKEEKAEGAESPAPAQNGCTKEVSAALAKLPLFASCREQVSTTLAESHKRHVQALREVVAMRLALVRTKVSFKP